MLQKLTFMADNHHSLLCKESTTFEITETKQSDYSMTVNHLPWNTSSKLFTHDVCVNLATGVGGALKR